MSFSEKASTVRQIFEIMNAVHSVDVSEAEHFASRKAWYNSFDKDASLADIERYTTQNIFTAEQGYIICAILEKFYKSHTGVTPVLNHGDITMDNLLWHDGKVVSLLDFECSVIAPPQLDLHSMTNEFINGNQSEQKYIGDIKDLYKSLLSQDYERDLLLGYAFLFNQRFLEFWLNEPEGEIGQCGAYQNLLSFIDGTGGYLSELLTEK